MGIDKFPPLGGRELKGGGFNSVTAKTMRKNQRQSAFARELRRKQTDAEKALWIKLKDRQIDGLKFRRQQPIGPYIVDFVCFDRKLIIEIDGGHHSGDKMLKEDNDRSKWLTEQNYQVLRFWNNEVLMNQEGVLERIRTASSPSP